MAALGGIVTAVSMYHHGIAQALLVFNTATIAWAKGQYTRFRNRRK